MTAACRRLAGTTAAALLLHTFSSAPPAAPLRPAPPPLQDTEGSPWGDRRTPTPGFPLVLLRLAAADSPAGAASMIAAQLLAYYFTELKDDQLKRVSSPRRARRWLRQQASDAGRAAEREQAGRLAAGRRMRRMQEGTVAHSPGSVASRWG